MASCPPVRLIAPYARTLSLLALIRHQSIRAQGGAVLESEHEEQERFTLLRRTSHFLLSGQEKVAKEKATPLARFPGIRPESPRSGYGVCRQHVVC